MVSPELLKILAEMGRGDEIVLVDGHFPGHTFYQTVVRADEIRIPGLCAGIIPLFGLDSYVDPLIMMAAVEGDRLDPKVEAACMKASRESVPAAPAVKRHRAAFPCGFFYRSPSADPLQSAFNEKKGRIWR